MRNKRRGVAARIVAAGLVAGGIATALVGCSSAHAPTPTQAAPDGAVNVPAYRHIFYIMMENHSYEDIIGNSNAPHINALASEYGLATNYWGVTHPSEPNYVASVAGSNYNVASDAPYLQQQVKHPDLSGQLEAASLSWKTYQQSLPAAGFTGTAWPSAGVALYAAKHNPFLNFLARYGPVASRTENGISYLVNPNAAQQAELAKMVPDTQLATDLANGTAPNFSYIVPDQCHDMHGIAGYTDNGVSCDDGAQSALIRAGDTYVNDTVNLIMRSKTWQDGNNAIVITWDENDFGAANGNPDIASDGGRVPTIVIANNGPRAMRYMAPSNHYALLLTIEDAFHLGCLANSCPATGNVLPMTPLFHD